MIAGDSALAAQARVGFGNDDQRAITRYRAPVYEVADVTWIGGG